MSLLLTTVHAIVFLFSFFLIWIGSGYIISGTELFPKRLRLSAFAFSFVVLGLLTSSPETAVGLTSIANNEPEVFVGTLIGGVAVIFLFIIPILAIAGNGVKIKHEMHTSTLLFTLFVILAPSIFALDKRITSFEGVIMIALYLGLLYVVERRHGLFDKENNSLMNIRAYSMTDLGKVLFGVVLVFFTSQVIVYETEYFSTMLNVSPFYVSLILLGLGANLPELSLAIRSVLSGNKDVAMGDYMGSTAANTLLFGIFTLMSKGEVLLIKSFFVTFIFIFISLLLFFIFSRTKQALSRIDGIFFLVLYIIFIMVELLGK